MIWWQWMVLGAFLLGAEIAVDAEFYLVFLGISAISIGLIEITPIELPIWGQWLVFALIASVNLSLFRSRIYHKIRGQIPERAEGVDGASILRSGDGVQINVQWPFLVCQLRMGLAGNSEFDG